MATNSLKNVTILSNSIRYLDLSEKMYEAVLPKQLHSVLEEKLRYIITNAGRQTFSTASLDL
jgi:hypothetical protein